VLDVIMTGAAVSLPTAPMRDYVTRTASTTDVADDNAHPASLETQQSS
jgi:hypothetical protein